jgi:hypothetical protein
MQSNPFGLLTRVVCNMIGGAIARLVRLSGNEMQRKYYAVVQNEKY